MTPTGEGPIVADRPLEVGAAPFDPGPEVGYDQRRAARAARQRAREEEQRGVLRRRVHELRLQREREKRRAGHQTALGRPTFRAALALAAVTAVAGMLGAAVGLPVPVLSDSSNPIAASLAGNSLDPVDPGTPPGLTKGPYFPVATERPNFGEAAARFGASRSGHIHQGQDMFAKPGTPLVAVRDGIVIDGAGGKSFYGYGGGNSLVIYSPIDDRSYVYMHMLKPALFSVGDQVQAGQVVGRLGCTGSCDGPHLHFEIRRGRIAYRVERKAVDPLPDLKQWPAAPAQ